MARPQPQDVVTLPLLERLIDRELESPSDPPQTRAQSVRQLRAALRRDLEWLLNTRATPETAPPALVELQKSVYAYGLPDISGLSYDTPSDRVRLLRLLENTVSLFEPRLTRVRITPLDAERANRHILRFQIEGLLLMDPAPEHIAFDTVLQLASGQYEVKGDGSAG